MSTGEEMYGDAVLNWKREIEINNIKHVNELIEKQELIKFIEKDILNRGRKKHKHENRRTNVR